MATLASLRNRVIAKVPEANDLLIDRTIIEIIRDFCEYTRAWRSYVAITVNAATLEVVLTPPADAEMVDIVSCERNGQDILKRTPEQIKQLVPKWRTAVGEPKYVTIGDDLDELWFCPTSPIELTDVEARIAWKPLQSATTVPDKLVSKYSEEIINGTVGRLMIEPDTPWADTARGGYYIELYDDQKDAAKVKVTAGDMTGVVRNVRYGGI